MKTSHLTRAVFRAILTNQPYLIRGCHRQAFRRQPAFARQQLTPYIRKRSLFTALLGTVNLTLDGAKASPKNLEVALGKLVDLIRARRTNSRTPPDEELVSAFKFVFRVRLEAKKRLTRNEVFLVTEAYRYFKEQGLVGHGSEVSALSGQDLQIVLSTLALPSQQEKFRSDTRALATLVFNSFPPSSTIAEDNAERPIGSSETTSLLGPYITILARTGSATEALKILRDAKESQISNDVRAWIEVVKGLVTEARGYEFRSAISSLKQRINTFTTTEYEELLSFLAANDKLEDARWMYELQVKDRIESSSKELRQLVELCAREKDFDWGRKLARILRGRMDDDGVLGTLLIWVSVGRSGTAEIVDTLERFIQENQPANLNIDPLNQLYEFGLQQKSPEITAAVMELANILDIRLNGKSYALQLKHALDKSDLIQAKLVYEQMVHQDIPPDDSDIPTLNKFLAVLAFTPDPPYALIMRVVDFLLERNADFDAEALAGLCKVFLRRDELEDATGMLRYRADFYPEADRARIASIFEEFILDKSTSDQRSFNAYEIYRFAFPETPIERKLGIMDSFFGRNRSDLACLVFGHMRQREDTDARPTAESYARCFQGIAKCQDVDGLQIVHNMLKLDLEVEPTTRVRNGMMLAYIACRLPFTAMIDNFWKILDSHQGPSYSTFEIGLRACETWVPQGGFEARKIMAIVQAWNLEITKELYESYIGALAGQSEFEYAIELIEEMENDTGERPDAITIGTFYNAIPWQYRKDEVEKWAKKAYPDLWEDLLEYGDEIDEEWAIRYFKIPRDIDIDDALLFASGEYNPLISRQAVQALEPPST